MTTSDLLSKIEAEITKADQALTKVPKDNFLALRAAMVPLMKLRIAKEVILWIVKKFAP